MHRQIFSFLLPAIVLCCSIDVAVACTCMATPSPCASYKDTPVVFVGLVTSIEEDKVDIVRFGETRTVRTGLLAHFTVEEPLKGIKVKTVDVATGGGGGDCGYPFKEGLRYLVYAYRSEDEALNSSMSRTVIGDGRSSKPARLSANICSRTRPLENATDDVELIRGLVRGKRETRVFGTVDEYAQKLGKYEYDIDRVGPMSNVKLIAQSANDRYETTTDQNGRYRISNPKPGKYKLSVLLPEGGFASKVGLFDDLWGKRAFCPQSHYLTLNRNPHDHTYRSDVETSSYLVLLPLLSSLFPMTNKAHICLPIEPLAAAATYNKWTNKSSLLYMFSLDTDHSMSGVTINTFAAIPLAK